MFYWIFTFYQWILKLHKHFPVKWTGQGKVKTFPNGNLTKYCNIFLCDFPDFFLITCTVLLDKQKLSFTTFLICHWGWWLCVLMSFIHESTKGWYANTAGVGEFDYRLIRTCISRLLTAVKPCSASLNSPHRQVVAQWLVPTAFGHHLIFPRLQLSQIIANLLHANLSFPTWKNALFTLALYPSPECAAALICEVVKGIYRSKPLALYLLAQYNATILGTYYSVRNWIISHLMDVFLVCQHLTREWWYIIFHSKPLFIQETYRLDSPRTNCIVWLLYRVRKYLSESLIMTWQQTSIFMHGHHYLYLLLEHVFSIDHMGTTGIVS